MKLYLAYGSNLNKKQMARRCPGAEAAGGIILPGYRLVFKGSKTGAYLTYIRDKKAVMPGGFWVINDLNEESLDRYEGYPIFYRKEEGVFKYQGKDLGFLIYKMNEGRSYEMPSPSYVETCRQGYRDFGFDEKYLDEALEYTKEKIDEARRKAKSKKLS